MNPAQYFPQDYGHPDRNQEEVKSSRSLKDQPRKNCIDSDCIDEPPVNELDEAGHQMQSDLGLGLPVDTDSDVT